MLAAKMALKNWKQMKVARCQFWAIRRMGKLFEATPLNLRLCNARLVNWCVVMERQHPASQIPTPLLDCLVQHSTLHLLIIQSHIKQ